MAAGDHLNRATLCAIDIRTSGITPVDSEILQIAIVPLTYQLEYDGDPFNVYIKPNGIVPGGAARANAAAMPFIEHGIQSKQVPDLLNRWMTARGFKRFCPITYSWPWAFSHLVGTFGREWTDDIFNSLVARSLVSAITLLQDREACAPNFSGYTLTGLTLEKVWSFAKTAPIAYGDGLSHALCHAAVWRALCTSNTTSLAAGMAMIALNKKRTETAIKAFGEANPARMTFTGDQREAEDILSNAQPE